MGGHDALAATKDQPFVSVITVALNAAKTIERTIESVVAQVYPNLEYLVVDGGSADGTVDIIRSHQDSIVWWVSEPDRGISDAFNKGIAHARGEWVGILNADDWYEPEAIEKAMRHAEGAAVVAGWQKMWHDDEPIEIVRPNVRLMAREMTVNHPTCFVRREMYQKYGVFDTKLRYAMDYEFMLRLFLAGERFEEVPTVIANMAFGGLSDKAWKLACQESRDAKVRHGLPAANAALYYRWQIARRGARRWMEAIGLERAVALYRRHLSTSAKHSASEEP